MNKLNVFQNKYLRIITKLSRVTPIITLIEQTGMSLIRSQIRKLARAVYQKSASSDSSQIKALGHYEPIGDMHLRPLSLLVS
jgi:uncharacterized protein YqgV (UPF0045/DUF77 family)